MDLVEFLLARLAEDELVARAAIEVNPPPWSLHVWRGESYGLVMSNKQDHLDGALWDNEGAESLSMEKVTAEHVARHDPARVLADVEAKRLILTDHPNLNADWGPPDDEYSPQPICSRCEDRKRHDALAWPCPTLRAIGLPYADHPDYQPEWKP